MTAGAERASRARRVTHLPWRRLAAVDWVLLVAVLAALAAGTAIIYSATLRGEAVERLWDDLVVKQLVFALISILVLVLFALTEYRVLLALHLWIYGAMLIPLVLLPTVGQTMLGARRWFTAGGIALQPSELTKIAMIIFLAAYFERHDIRRVRTVVGSLAFVGLAMFLVLIQPNLSTAILLGFIWLGMAFAAGIRPVHLSILVFGAAPLAWLALTSQLIKAYQLDRIRFWLNPEADPGFRGYQAIQTVIAVGNGGMWGTGYASGMQAQGGWLVVPFTDNIFAIVAEELGFVGSLAFLSLLFFILQRIFRAARSAQDYPGGLIIAGVGTYLTAQIFVNIGVVLQIFPVTGISLPFISYGGSSLIAAMAAIGMVQSVLLRRRPLEFR